MSDISRVKRGAANALKETGHRSNHQPTRTNVFIRKSAQIVRSSVKFALAVGMAAGLCQSAQAVPFLFDGHYYDVVSANGISWTAANNQANASSYLGLAGHLVTITSAAEDAFVFSLVNGAGEHWSGGFQNPITETNAGAGWTWVNGEGPFSYTNWESTEPNDTGGAGNEQYMGVGFFGSGGWNDEASLANIRGFVVEYQSTPDGGSTAALMGLAICGLFGVRSMRRGSAFGA